MSTLQAQVSQSLEGLSEENLNFLLYMINHFMKSEAVAGVNRHENKICRPLGMFKDEKFYADGYDIDEDNEEIARMFYGANQEMKSSRSIVGIAHEYASPELMSFEDEAFANAMAEKHGKHEFAPKNT